MQSQSFKGQIVKSGSRAFVSVPFDPDSVWGVKERHYVTGSVNGCTVRGRIEPIGDGFGLTVGPVWRRDNGIDIGMEVDVVLAPEGPQGERLAADVLEALEAEPRAKEFFEGLATFYRKNYIRWIESAKRPETRAARVREMVGLLKEGKRQK